MEWAVVIQTAAVVTHPKLISTLISDLDQPRTTYMLAHRDTLQSNSTRYVLHINRRIFTEQLLRNKHHKAFVFTMAQPFEACIMYHVQS